MPITLQKHELILGGLYALLQLFVLPVLLSIVNFYLQFPVWLLNVILFFLNFACSTAIYFQFLKDNLRLSLSNPWRTLRYAGQGLVLYYISSFLIGLIVAFFAPSFQNLNDGSVYAMTAQGGMLMVLATVFFVPPAEELLFRGLIFRGLYDRSKLAAWVVSCVAFSLVHIIGYIGLYTPQMLLIAFLQYIPAGLCLCYAYVKSGSILAPMLMHIAINQIALSITG